MRTQSVIFLALLGVMALLSSTATGSSITLDNFQSFINAESDCILRDQNCDTTGILLKLNLPTILKNCTVAGCPPGKPKRVVELTTILSKYFPAIWQQILTKYT